MLLDVRIFIKNSICASRNIQLNFECVFQNDWNFEVMTLFDKYVLAILVF